MNSNSTKQRRSLKEALRTILLKCRRPSPVDLSNIVGSGILRRDPSLANLPNDSITAFLFGLDSAEYIEHDCDDIPDRFDITSLATSAAMSSTRTLMPKMSLSQFDYHPPIQEARYLHRGQLDSVSASLADGASYQASFCTLNSFRSTSTLRIQSSSQTLRSEWDTSCSQPSFPEKIDHGYDPISRPNSASQYPSPPRVNHSLSPKRNELRKRKSFGTVASPSPLRQVVQPEFALNCTKHAYPMSYDYSSRFSRPLSVIEEVASYVDGPLTPRGSPIPYLLRPTRSSTPQSLRSTRSRTSVSSKESQQASPTLKELIGTSSIKSGSTCPESTVKHFSSICALDTTAPGCPVIATSGDMRYIFELGENFCLNMNGYDGATVDVITGSDSCGNPVTHLVFLTPLIIPHSGRSRFMLASMVDITDAITDTLSLPELEMVSEESVDSDPPTPRYKPQVLQKVPEYQLSAENLLGGCFVDEPRTPVQRHDEDIWINLATEERKQYSQYTKTSSGLRTPVSATSSLPSIDDVLDDFMCKLQELHSDFFLLAKSPLDDNYYEICNVSPRVYESRDYVNGHLSKTSAADMVKLSGHLAGDGPFDIRVRWGTQGVPKHLYCMPLFARSAVTWICFLVNPGLPILW